MSLLNPRQFFKREPLKVTVSEGAPAPKQAAWTGQDVRSSEQKVLDQQQFNDKGLPYAPRHRASTD